MTGKRRALEEFLVIEARLGRRAAMAELVRLRGPRLLVHAARLLNGKDEAQDAVQDAWVQIFRDLQKLKDVAAFPAWATRIVSRCCYRIIEKRIRVQDAKREITPLIEDSCEVDLNEEAQILRQAIDALPTPQRAAIALFYLEDMSLAEVAVSLDVPVGTVKSRLSMARMSLKDALKGDLDV
ncbi:RNA polymerase sigma factor [Cognatishimia sp. D5M38]|uniref:RNA polymerase sigma factor n=1 Tax=Cognatishimia coralii TaxID=3083254 RepID=A0ABU8QDG6_9RHOB